MLQNALKCSKTLQIAPIINNMNNMINIKITNILNIMNIMNNLNITAWMAMAGAISALVQLQAGLFSSAYSQLSS